MQHPRLEHLRQNDWWLNGAVLLFMIFSLAIIFSLESAGGEPGRFLKQLIFVLLGIILLWLTTYINYRKVVNYGYVLYIIGILVLVAVLLFGVTIHGTTGWFQLAGMSVQPVEFVKIIFVVVLARFLGDHAHRVNNWKVVAKILGLLAGYIVLVLLQPDLGSAGVLVATGGIMLFCSSVSLKKIAVLVAVGAVLAILAWLFYFSNYQRDRILTFIQPERDPLVSGYNVKQAVISVGSGQLFGRGLGLGTQTQLKFLPERETDFIFAVIAEELGFVGVVVILALYVAVYLRLLKGVKRSRDDYARFLLIGFAGMLFTQMFINLGMNLGIMPVTGIPLPFVSAGGSSLLALCTGIGLMQNSLRER
ncbi:MAG: Rod shape-determining protein RodA [uncultured bacterium]|nr:MAG: Rod shape-determining protein RodA [uncultured bacterium]